MDYIKLGIRIRNCRKSLNYTQERLSELAGISLSFLGHIERGTRKASVETLVNLCNAMNTSPGSLLQDSLNASILGIPNEGTRKQQDFMKEISHVVVRFMNDEKK